MDLRDMLLAELSKAQCMKIVRWIGQDKKRFRELISLFMNDEYRVVQRAAWPLSYAAEAHPILVEPYFEKLILHLRKPGLPDAVKRNTIRIFQHIQVPQRLQGELMDLCFGYISSPDEKPAVKAFSLTVLENMTIAYPDIKPELKLIIEDRWDYESAAFRSRARKILKKL